MRREKGSEKGSEKGIIPCFSGAGLTQHLTFNIKFKGVCPISNF